MNLTDVKKSVKARPRKKRLGRGAASGLGKTAGKGDKGLSSRTGHNYLRNFVGGQTQLKARFAKRGFNNVVFMKIYTPVNVAWIEATFEDGEEVTLETMRKKGQTLSSDAKVKVLGDGELTKKVKVTAHAFSKSAKGKIEKAGGEAMLIGVSLEHKE